MLSGLCVSSWTPDLRCGAQRQWWQTSPGTWSRHGWHEWPHESVTVLHWNTHIYHIYIPAPHCKFPLNPAYSIAHASKMLPLIVLFLPLQFSALVCTFNNEACLRQRSNSVHKDGDVVIGCFLTLYFYIYYTGIFDIRPTRVFHFI